MTICHGVSNVQCLTNWAKLAFACESETFSFLYSYALLILGESSTCKRWSAAWKKQFKDPLTSTCQYSPVGLAWTPNLVIISCIRSSPTEGNFFVVVKSFTAISVNFVLTVKNSNKKQWVLVLVPVTDQCEHFWIICQNPLIPFKVPVLFLVPFSCSMNLLSVTVVKKTK